MNKIFMYHLVLIGFFSNVCAMERVKDLIGFNSYPCVLQGASIKSDGTIAFMNYVTTGLERRNIDSISYDAEKNEASLQLKDRSVVLKDHSLDAFMDRVCNSSDSSHVTVQTTMKNKPGSVNWRFLGKTQAQACRAAVSHSVRKCKDALELLNGPVSAENIVGVSFTAKSQETTGTLSHTSNPYFPGSRLRLTNDKNEKQSVLVHRDLVQLLYNACKAAAMYNKEKEASTQAKQILVDGVFPHLLGGGTTGQSNQVELATLQLLERDLPVMEQWLYAQKIKKYMQMIGLGALIAAIGGYFYSQSNA